jgi:hypothetical protein
MKRFLENIAYYTFCVLVLLVAGIGYIIMMPIMGLIWLLAESLNLLGIRKIQERLKVPDLDVTDDFYHRDA